MFAQGRLDKLASRWNALKPGKEMKGWSTAEVEAVFAAFADWKSQTDNVKAAVQAVVDSCETFGLGRPSFDGLTAFEADYAETTAAWDTYKAYDAERTALASQDWISFRAHMFDLQVRTYDTAHLPGHRLTALPSASSLQDFASKWIDAVKGKTRDVVCSRIHDESDAVKRGFNALKFVRGEPFKVRP